MRRQNTFSEQHRNKMIPDGVAIHNLLGDSFEVGWSHANLLFKQRHSHKKFDLQLLLQRRIVDSDKNISFCFLGLQ